MRLPINANTFQRLMPAKALHDWRGRLTGVADDLVPSVVRDSLWRAEAQGWAVDDASDYCPRCGASSDPSAVTGRGCPHCLGHRFAWQRLTRLGPYQSPWADWIKQLKFGGHWPWAYWMGRQLAEVIGPPMDARRVVVCPVPLHWRRRWTRGFNQSLLIAQALAEQRDWPCIPVLQRSRYAVPQSQLAPSQRQSNVRQCFTLANVDLTNHEVILIDDVKTTGATLTQCARLLRRSGATTVHVAVVAVADPRGMDFKTI